MQRCGNAFEQGEVDAVLAENPVDVGAGAANVLSQLCGRYALLPHYLFDMLPDVHEKSVEYVQLADPRFPRLSTNKSFHAKTRLAFRNGFLVDSLSRKVENWVKNTFLKSYSIRLCVCVYCAI